MLVDFESSFHQKLEPQNCMKFCVIDLETKSQKIGDFYSPNLFKICSYAKVDVRLCSALYVLCYETFFKRNFRPLGYLNGVIVCRVV